MIEYKKPEILSFKPDEKIDISQAGKLKYLKDFPKPLQKTYQAGMYGGKFLPMHKGHLYCVDQASQLCETVYLILFYGGFWEKLIRELDERDIFSKEARWNQVKKVAEMYDNVQPFLIDISNCITPDGREDWDAETPLVLNTCPTKFTSIFGSEPVMYAPYFERAYPWADYIVVDVDRKEVPISATMIRHELSEEEAKKWIV